MMIKILLNLDILEKIDDSGKTVYFISESDCDNYKNLDDSLKTKIVKN